MYFLIFIIGANNVNIYFSFIQTPFVRQNTPHPKDLKAKAHKLLAGRSPEAVNIQATKTDAPTPNGLPISPTEVVHVPIETTEVSLGILFILVLFVYK